MEIAEVAKKLEELGRVNPLEFKARARPLGDEG